MLLAVGALTGAVIDVSGVHETGVGLRVDAAGAASSALPSRCSTI